MSPPPDRLPNCLPECDVVILGGGLAGLCCAIQLKRLEPEVRVVVLERSRAPLPDAAHKVGESSVEAASHYFRNTLGVSDLLDRQLPKFGLRFFIGGGASCDLTRRLECGPKHFLTVPSYQIDRGRFENELADRAAELGVDVQRGAQVRAVDLADDGGRHRVHWKRGDERGLVSGRWVVDSSGRTALLKKKLGLGRASRHKVNAAWFRVDHPIDPDAWSQDPAWRDRLDEPRRLSTNHLMGAGYWVWLIALPDGRTSVGIVADDALHPFPQISTFEKALAWLEAHEPQCAAAVRDVADTRMDFLARKAYAHDAKQVFSADRWCVTGDAGIFIDPLYSPGSDFIGMSNGFICDLIQRDLRGESVEGLAEAHDTAYRALARTYLATYYRQYPLMGHPRVMSTKIVWDFVMYWGGVALIFAGDRLCQPAFMERAAPLLQRFALTNLAMQAFFRRWAAAGEGGPPPEGAFVDYAGLAFLAQLNADLADRFDDDALIERLARNLQLAADLKLEIMTEASRGTPTLGAPLAAPVTRHLEKMFEVMRGETEQPGALRL